ncbi:nickel and cobalt efflux transporter rcnA [Desulfocucumis palustris]|uniref:Nickel/cobalt efflux system n=1 Tax=Desulfocucumis palustris TaxID=1898651 RepID=A0A2L2XIW4_9FIRM|nr:sulfite exporter TauE/SafE family protein [Desulfocucumis palustris]GBF35653.1 nickel and cobalt efflux transporter rcnA [Desulfocucumis palustris]
MDLFWGMISALGLGALHALEPGHGKSVMGAYLAVSGSRISDALTLGIASAATHTLVVITLAFLLDNVVGAVSTGNGVPGERFEGYLKMFSGILIVIIGFGMLGRLRKKAPCGCCHHGNTLRPGSSRASALLVGISNGLMPCPGALAVLLMSLSAGKIAKGIWLVLAFGIGGAAALVTVGLVFVKASSLLKKLPGDGTGRGLTLASACLIMTIGFFTVLNGVKNI